MDNLSILWLVMNPKESALTQKLSIVITKPDISSQSTKSFFPNPSGDFIPPQMDTSN